MSQNGRQWLAGVAGLLRRRGVWKKERPVDEAESDPVRDESAGSQERRRRKRVKVMVPF